MKSWVQVGSVFFSAMLLVQCQSGSGPSTPAGLPVANPVLFQEGGGPFRFSDHYIDNQTGIVLTLFKFREDLSNFVPNFRGVEAEKLPFKASEHSGWKVEYFCEPDYVVGVYGESFQTVAYFNSLQWHENLYFDQKNNQTILSYRYLPENGWFENTPYFAKTKDLKAPPIYLAIHFMWPEGKHVVKVQVDAVNRTGETIDISMAFQDAAFMWFPFGDQRDVAGAIWHKGEFLDRQHMATRPLPPVIASTYSKTHGVISGFRHISSAGPDGQPAAFEGAGIAYRYVLTPKYVPTGFQISLGDDQGRDLAGLMERQIYAVEASEDLKFLNRYLAYQFKDIRAEEAVRIRFDLVMGVGDPATPAENLTNFL